MTADKAIPIALLLLLTSAAVGCGGSTARKQSWDSAASANPEVEAAFRTARKLFSNEEYGDADEGFARLISLYPDDPLARISTVYRARIALEMDHPKRAIQLLAPLTSETDPVADRARLYSGVALYREGQFTDAIAILTPIQHSLTDADESTLLMSTLWRAQQQANDVEAAITTIDKLLAQTSDDAARDDATTALEEMVARMTSLEPLTTLAKSLPSTDNAWPVIMARIAALHLEAGRFKESADILDAIEKRDRTETKALKKLSEEVDSRLLVNMSSVGLLVPLSGRSRLVGETVVKGAMVAASKTGVDVIIRDTKGDPSLIEGLVRQLVEEEHVFGIIGPLDGAAAKAASTAAEEMRVPIVLLTIRDDLTLDRPFVFRNFADNRAELEALLQTAKDAGHRTIGVLRPDSPFGDALMELAKAAAAQEEMSLIADVAYDPKSTSFGKPAEKIAAATPDAILLLDAPPRVALLAPALAAAGLWSVHAGDEPQGPGAPVQLLIPSFGYTPDLLRRAGRYLQGAHIALYFEPGTTPNSEEFASRFNIDYGKQPGYLSAFGHDAVMILHAVSSDNVTDREGVRSWLAETAAKQSGQLDLTAPFAGFSPSGEPLAGPWVMEYNDGALVDLLQN